MIDRSYLEKKPRVLIVDNNERVASMLIELLAHWGYTPILAQGIGSSLLRDAKEKSNSHRCQLALVDLRLVDDFDSNDISGIQLTSELKPTHSIILSGSEDLPSARAGEFYKNAALVYKSIGPREIKDVLDREARKICAAKRGMEIKPAEILTKLSLLFPNLDSEFQDQYTDLLAQLFPSAHSLQIDEIHSGGSPEIYPELRPKSKILKVYEGNRDPVIVLIADARKIEREAANYQTYIRDRLVGTYHSVWNRSIALWDIGGSVYSYFGEVNFQPFSDYFLNETPDHINQFLETFFMKTWSKNFTNIKLLNKVSLFQLYCEIWGTNWYQRLYQNADDSNVGDFVYNAFHLPNPIMWLKNYVAGNSDEDVSFVEQTFTAVTHGDLHGDNILIDDYHNPHLIDFGRTGEGHIMQDFVELEVDIVTRLTNLEDDFLSFYKLCQILTIQRELYEFDGSQVERIDPELKKTIQVISSLRSIARKVTGISDGRQYLFGLLFNLLFRASIMSGKEREHVRKRSLIFASFICHRLDHWNEPWPPREWLALV